MKSLISEILSSISISFSLIYNLSGILKSRILYIVSLLLTIIDNTPLSRPLKIKRSEMSGTAKTIRRAVERYRNMAIDVAC